MFIRTQYTCSLTLSFYIKALQWCNNSVSFQKWVSERDKAQVSAKMLRLVSCVQTQFEGLGNLRATPSSFGTSSVNADGKWRQSLPGRRSAGQNVETSCTSSTVNSSTQRTRALINHKLLSRALFWGLSTSVRVPSSHAIWQNAGVLKGFPGMQLWKSSTGWRLLIHAG